MVNEKRLIDANEVKDEILSWAVCINKPHLLSRDDTLCVIDNAPTVDAVEVVHGRWTTRTVANWLYEEACSICGFCGCEEFNYCPNCGAKMDGDGND